MSKDRYVVVDLNAMEEGLFHYLHDEDQVVLPHMIMSDLAGIKQDKRMNKHINCLPEWLRTRGNQVWLAHSWGVLEDMEPSPDILVEGCSWRDDEGSKALRSGKDATPEQWLESFRDFESSIGRVTVEGGRKGLFYACEQIGKRILINNSHIISDIKSSQCWRKCLAKWIRDPIMGHIHALLKDPKYRTQEWHDALGCFPDKFSVGRTSRIMCWYSMLQAAGIRKVQDNDFEDMAYAHAASYTGFLTSEDKCLADMVKAVFENVTIVSKQ
jgi:hypothetical protein